MKPKKKKKNAQDLTLRNLRALKTRIDYTEHTLASFMLCIKFMCETLADRLSVNPEKKRGPKHR